MAPTEKIESHTQKIESLFEACRSNNRIAQESLYRLTSSNMMAVCMRYAASTYEAEEIMQTGYIKVFSQISTFRQQGSFEGWIRRIMVNTAIEFFRRSKHTVPLMDIESASAASDPGLNMDSLELQDLLKLIQELPDGYRMVFNMYAIEGYSHREIAEQLDISESTSKTQLLRARERLKKRITQLEGGNYESKQA